MVHGRRLSLPQEICAVSRERLRGPRGTLTTAQKSAEGIVEHGVGKASEALRKPKGGGNREAEPETGLEGPNDRSGQ